MADSLCSNIKTLSNSIDNKSIDVDQNIINNEKLNSLNNENCINNIITIDDTQKNCLKYDYNMTINDHKVIFDNFSNDNHKKMNDINNLNEIILSKTENNNIGLYEMDSNNKIDINNDQENDESPNKKKRCSDRYDSSESSDSGVATLSCNDSNTASSDTSDPGSPYSSVSLNDDLHQGLRTNMPPQISIQNLQINQNNNITTLSQHQWPWDTSNIKLNNIYNNNNNNNISANNHNYNIIAKNNKNKRLHMNNINDINPTAVKKIRSSSLSNNNNDKLLHINTTSAIKRYKNIEQSQTKITGYFKSQMKPINYLKNGIKNIGNNINDINKLNDFDNYMNLLTKVNNIDNNHKNNYKNDIDIDVRTLTTTMTQSYKKYERKFGYNNNNSNNNKLQQIIPSRTIITSNKKNVPIAPRLNDINNMTFERNRINLQQQYDTISKIQQPTVLLTAIRLQQTNGQHLLTAAATSTTTSINHNQLNNKLLTTSTTSLTTQTNNFNNKMCPILQIPVISSNILQYPNLFTTTTTSSSIPAVTTTNCSNLLINNNNNNGQLTTNGTTIATTSATNTGNLQNGQQQYFLNGAVIKLQQFNNNNNNNNINGTTNILTNGQISTATQVKTSEQQQNYTTQSLLMATTNGLLINTTIPAVLTTTTTQQTSGNLSNINGQQHHLLPSLHPIQTINNCCNTNTLIPNLSPIINNNQQQYIVTKTESTMNTFNNIPALSTISNITTKSKLNITLSNNNLIPPPPLTPIPPLITLSNRKDINSIKPISNINENNLNKINNQIIENKLIKNNYHINNNNNNNNKIDDNNPKISKDISKINDKIINNNSTISTTQILPPKSMILDEIQNKNDVLVDDLLNNKLIINGQLNNDKNIFNTPTIITDLKTNNNLLSDNLKSPILTEPKIIRFPVQKTELLSRNGNNKGIKRHDGICYWDNCEQKYDTCSKLLDHLQTQHVNTQTGPFVCLWSGCKVHGRNSCSRRWLERHVLSHGGTKPFKCIVDGCGLRFGSQLALQKHVNGHFTTTENKDNSNKRTSDPPITKLLRKNGKKLRYRRQPFSARMFDFFDSGIMEGLQHRLIMTEAVVNGPKGSITFKGSTTAKRHTLNGKTEIFVRWIPSDIISDEWVPETKSALTKTIQIHSMQFHEQIALQKFLEKTRLKNDVKTIFNQPIKSIVESLNNNLKMNGKKQSRKPPRKIQPS